MTAEYLSDGECARCTARRIRALTQRDTPFRSHHTHPEASVQVDLGRARQISFESLSSAGEEDNDCAAAGDESTNRGVDGAGTGADGDTNTDEDEDCGSVGSTLGDGDCGSVGSDDSGDLSLLGVARRESTASMAAVQGDMLEDDDLAYCVLTTSHMQKLSIWTLSTCVDRRHTAWIQRCFRRWAQATVRVGVAAEVSRIYWTSLGGIAARQRCTITLLSLRPDESLLLHPTRAPPHTDEQAGRGQGLFASRNGQLRLYEAGALAQGRQVRRVARR